jgi:hypothetical protein
MWESLEQLSLLEIPLRTNFKGKIHSFAPIAALVQLLSDKGKFTNFPFYFGSQYPACRWHNCSPCEAGSLGRNDVAKLPVWLN